MKVPIPGDWNGEDWHCLQIEWPDSPQWTGLLTGILTLLTRGRYWEENSGTITDVQLIAWEIFSRAYPFISCEGETLPPTPPETIFCYGGEGTDLEMLMAYLTDITCEDGVLTKWWGKCCSEPIDCDPGSIINPPPPDPEIDPEDPQTWACNKSAGMADAFFSIIQEVVNAIDAIGSVYDMYAPCHAILSRYGAAWSNSQQVCAAYVNHSAEVDTMAADSDTPNWMTCSWATTLLPTDTLSSEEFFTIKTSYYARWLDGADGFLIALTVALRIDNFAWWARLFHDNAASCDCPSEPAEQADWQFTGAWTLDSASSGTTINSVDVQHGGRRVEIEITYGDDDGFATASGLNLAVNGPVANDEPLVRIYPKPGTQHCPVSTWIVSDDPQTSDKWFDMSVGGEVGESTVRVNGSGYADLSIEGGVGLATNLICVGLRQYKDGGAGPGNTWQFCVEIVGVNGDNKTPIGPGA